MTITKEWRRFFTRTAKVTGGAEPDQETSYPVQYYKNGKLVYDSFITNGQPKQTLFEKLFESVTFKLNTSDTASISQQGLVEVATDAKAISRSNLDHNGSTDYTTVVRPSQLPDIANTDGSITVVKSGTTKEINTISATIGQVFVTTTYPISTLYPSGITPKVNDLCIVSKADDNSFGNIYGWNGSAWILKTTVQRPSVTFSIGVAPSNTEGIDGDYCIVVDAMGTDGTVRAGEVYGKISGSWVLTGYNVANNTRHFFCAKNLVAGVTDWILDGGAVLVPDLLPYENDTLTVVTDTEKGYTYRYNATKTEWELVGSIV